MRRVMRPRSVAVIGASSEVGKIGYAVVRNINYTNICYFRCGFCAFSKGKLAANLRGTPYDLGIDEMGGRTQLRGEVAQLVAAIGRGGGDEGPVVGERERGLVPASRGLCSAVA